MDLQQMSGEKTKVPQLKLNQIRFNGQTGEFMYKDILKGLQEKEGKKFYEEVPIGKEISIVFLKIRRKLVAFRKDEKPLTSQEHNTKESLITLYGNQAVETSDNDTLREKYPALKTQQIIYALYKGEMIRLVVKGSALGSAVKDENVHSFYSYISSFKASGKDEHFYEHHTSLYGVEEKGDLGVYSAMSFKTGIKLDETEMKVVEENMKNAFDYCVEMDAYYNKNKKEIIKEEMDKPKEVDSTEIPEEDISPEDIPF